MYDRYSALYTEQTEELYTIYTEGGRVYSRYREWVCSWYRKKMAMQ